MKDNPFFDKLLQKRTVDLEDMLRYPRSFTKQAIEAASYILEERIKCVDYTQYTYYDLIDVKNHINAEKYPVRAALLYQEISRRKRSEDFKSVAEKNQLDSIKINPRLGVIFKGNNDLNDEVEITLDDFKNYLIKPTFGKYVKIEDSRIELFVIFDTNKSQHGFFLEYYDKYEKLEYRSKLHGLSKGFTIEYLKSFIEKGKSELQNLEWVLVKKKSLVSLILTLVPIAIFFTLSIFFNFKINPIYDLILEYEDLIFSFFMYLFLVQSIYNVFSNSEQFKNLSKLTFREKFDTISSIFVPLIIASFIYFDLTPF